METSNSDATYLDSGSPSLPINGGGIARVLQLPAIRFLQSPILSLLEYSGFLLPQSEYPNSETHPLLPESRSTSANVLNPSNSESGRGNAVGGNSDSGNSSNNGEVSIRIIGEQDRDEGVHNGDNGVNRDGNGNSSDDDNNNNSNNSEALSSRRYIQQAARWVEQILPFWLLLLVVFIRQHLEGFVVIIYCTAILFKSNAILRKQTALKGEKKIHVLVVYSILFMLHIFGIYWWHRRDELFYPLIMVPPKAIPPFWHAVFIILVNDTMVRQTAMVLKLVLLMYYKNGRGHTFHRQARMLTLVEYALLLYRAMLPAPVWYRFFLNKDCGSLFSTLTTGLYLTFKLTSIVKKVKFFLAAFKGLFRKEINYGSYATSEQVNATGDLCTICQEKMHAPILLRCKHIFCEDCVSEWLERERTCPLCRDVVRDAGLRSYGDGSTNLLFQLF